jgi:hypothetical protein
MLVVLALSAAALLCLLSPNLGSGSASDDHASVTAGQPDSEDRLGAEQAFEADDELILTSAASLRTCTSDRICLPRPLHEPDAAPAQRLFRPPRAARS